MIVLLGQIAVLVLSMVAIIAWYRRLRHYPLFVAVLLAMGSNVAFFILREAQVLDPVSLNILSNVRIILMLIVIIAIPFLFGKRL